MKKLLFLLPLMILAMSCSHTVYKVKENAPTGHSYTVNSNDAQLGVAPVPATGSSYIPKATAFRMSGDYADNVAVTLDANGNLIYFPDPSDITADSRPIDLGDGWWLNRQGAGQNSVFTKYTFAEYAELPNVPTPEQLKNSIIPGARITQFIQLPFNAGQAQNQLPQIKEYLSGK